MLPWVTGQIRTSFRHEGMWKNSFTVVYVWTVIKLWAKNALAYYVEPWYTFLSGDVMGTEVFLTCFPSFSSSAPSLGMIMIVLVDDNLYPLFCNCYIMYCRQSICIWDGSRRMSVFYGRLAGHLGFTQFFCCYIIWNSCRYANYFVFFIVGRCWRLLMLVRIWENG